MMGEADFAADSSCATRCSRVAPFSANALDAKVSANTNAPNKNRFLAE